MSASLNSKLYGNSQIPRIKYIIKDVKFFEKKAPPIPTGSHGQFKFTTDIN
jgi:hypothetical protein